MQHLKHPFSTQKNKASSSNTYSTSLYIKAKRIFAFAIAINLIFKLLLPQSFMFESSFSIISVPAFRKSLIQFELTSFYHRAAIVSSYIHCHADRDISSRCFTERRVFLFTSFISDIPRRSEESNWQCIHRRIPQAFMPQLSALPTGNFYRMHQNIKSSPDVLKCHNMKKNRWQTDKPGKICFLPLPAGIFCSGS